MAGGFYGLADGRIINIKRKNIFIFAMLTYMLLYFFKKLQLAYFHFCYFHWSIGSSFFLTGYDYAPLARALHQRACNVQGVRAACVSFA